MNDGPGWEPCNLAAASMLLAQVPEGRGQRELTVSESISPLPNFSWEGRQLLGGSLLFVGEGSRCWRKCGAVGGTRALGWHRPSLFID